MWISKFGVIEPPILRTYSIAVRHDVPYVSPGSGPSHLFKCGSPVLGACHLIPRKVYLDIFIVYIIPDVPFSSMHYKYGYSYASARSSLQSGPLRGLSRFAQGTRRLRLQTYHGGVIDFSTDYPGDCHARAP